MPLAPLDLNKSTGFLGAATSAANNNTSPKPNVDFVFWPQKDVIASNFSGQFPYQILVVKAQAGQDGKISYSQEKNWVFTLPIPPEALSISMPFAISVAATQGGVVEEHNGAPFRDISISGTTGILPLRGSATVLKTPPLNGILGGTVNQALQTANTAVKLATDLANVSQKQNLVTASDISTGDIGKTSGYYQFHLLREFLERYVQLKKTKEGFQFRLAFACWKDYQVYLVTPRGFNLSRTASSPYEYPYSLSFRAYKRIALDGQPPSAYSYKPAPFQSSVLGDVLKATQDARRLILSAADTIRALGMDIDRAILEPLRQTGLFCKDLLGIPQSLLDMPAQLIKDAKKSVLLFAAVQDDFSNFNNQKNNPNNNFTKQWNDIVKTAKTVGSLGQQVGSGESLNPQQSGLGSRVFDADPGNDPFNNPNKNFSLFENIELGQLQLPRELNLKIRAERNRVAKTKRIDWEILRNTTIQFLTDYENAVGAGDAVANATYNRGVNSTTRTPTSDDYDIIYSLNSYIQSLSQLAVAESFQTKNIGAVGFIAGLAAQSGIAFTQPQSKFLVPFPYNSTLEILAYRYLGDPDRWFEIAALNGLEAPYIDETGFDLPLLVDAHDNTVMVNSADNLFVGQFIYLISSLQNKTPRTIQSINIITTNKVLLTLSGDSDLDVYLVADTAVLHTWLPATVNSQMSLYIPSPDAPEFEDFIYKAIPGIKQLDQFFNVGNEDLLLTEKNDLIIYPDGSSPIAIGLPAIIQDIRLKVSTPQGSLMRHPTFGLPIELGASLADISASAILAAMQTMFLEDSTYTGLSSASVVVNGPSAVLNLSVGIRGVSQNIPVSLDLKQNTQ
jgi:hypothetical protein